MSSRVCVGLPAWIKPLDLTTHCCMRVCECVSVCARVKKKGRVRVKKKGRVRARARRTGAADNNACAFQGRRAIAAIRSIDLRQTKLSP